MRLRSFSLLAIFLPSILLAVGAGAQTTNGRVTTAAPTYASGTTAPLSLDTGGATRITCVSGCSGSGTSQSAGADAVSNTYTTTITASFAQLFNGSTWDRLRSVVSGTNSVGTGIAAVGNLGQFDDVAPQAITENQFGNLRMSTNRNLYVTLRDAAGNERGLNIDASGQLAITVASIPSHAVTNAGTFAVQAAITAASGSIASGAVASGAIASGAYASGSVGSGAIASGAYASGSIGSGAIASGAVASGAFASGSLASGACVDGCNVTLGAKADAKSTATDTTAITAMQVFKQISASVQAPPAIAAGTNTIGNVILVPSASAGGTSLFTLTLAASTNATNVKASAGQLYSISGFNTSSATPVWISLYNNAGTPTCGTSIIQQFMIPGSTTGAGFVYDFSSPKAFATGIAFCATTGIAGTGNPAATTYVLNIDYK